MRLLTHPSHISGSLSILQRPHLSVSAQLMAYSKFAHRAISPGPQDRHPKMTASLAANSLLAAKIAVLTLEGSLSEALPM